MTDTVIFYLARFPDLIHIDRVLNKYFTSWYMILDVNQLDLVFILTIKNSD